MKLNFSLKFLFLLLFIAAVVIWCSVKPPSISEHSIPVCPGFRFVSESVESTEHGKCFRWNFTTKTDLKTIKEFYDDAFSPEKYDLQSSIYGLKAQPNRTQLYLFTQESNGPVNMLEEPLEFSSTSIIVVEGDVTVEKSTSVLPVLECPSAWLVAG